MLTISAFIFGSIFALLVPVLGPMIFSIVCMNYFNLNTAEFFGIVFPLVFIQFLAYINFEK